MKRSFKTVLTQLLKAALCHTPRLIPPSPALESSLFKLPKICHGSPRFRNLPWMPQIQKFTKGSPKLQFLVT